MKRCLPGPYTFILPGTKLVPKIMTTKRKTVGIRVPDNNICLALVKPGQSDHQHQRRFLRPGGLVRSSSDRRNLWIAD